MLYGPICMVHMVFNYLGLGCSSLGFSRGGDVCTVLPATSSHLKSRMNHQTGAIFHMLFSSQNGRWELPRIRGT